MRPPRIFAPTERFLIAKRVRQYLLDGTEPSLRAAVKHASLVETRPDKPGPSPHACLKFFYQLMDNERRGVTDPLAPSSAFVTGSRHTNEGRQKRYRERVDSDPEFRERLKRIRLENYKPLPEMRREKGLPFFLRKMVHFSAARERKAGRQGFDLTPEGLERIWASQNGVCPLTGLAMDLAGDTRAPLVPSLDRIDPGRGYAEDNVRFVCYFANLMKRDFTDDDVTQLLTLARSYLVDGVPEAGPSLGPEQIEGRLQTCLRNLRKRSKNRDWDSDISLATLQQLYESQGGRCAITGVLMDASPVRPRSVSVDRIDSARPYTQENVQLVCLAVNMGKYQYEQDAFVNLVRATL